MKIGRETYVSLTYELRLDDQAEVVDRATEADPLEFVWGMGNLLPKFEQYLENLSENETFKFSLKPSEAYGERIDGYVTDVPMDFFKRDGVVNYDILKVGNVLPVAMQDGRVMNGLVVSFDEEKAIMDFNSPLAGKNLNFSGKILQVREATEEEMKAGHHGCCGDGGCGDGGCGDGSCHDHDHDHDHHHGDDHGCCCGGH